jgi:hypothetical protein
VQPSHQRITANEWRWLFGSLIVFVVSVATAIYVYLQNDAIAHARVADDIVNRANANKQPISFLVYPGEKYNNACNAEIGTPQKIGSSATPAPAPTFSPPPEPVSKNVTVGDVLQLTIVFNCAFNDPAAIAEMRSSQVQFKPEIVALDFDVAPILTDELDGRDFYCVAFPNDSVCTNGSTTPVQDLKWSWFLRPKSVGKHFIRVDIDQRKIVGKGQYAEVAPRWVREYTVGVRQPLAGDIGQWAPVVAAIAALIPIVTFVQKLLSRKAGTSNPESAN